MAEFVVAIPTFRRPAGLLRLLRALEALDTRHEISVLVADNDAAAHAGADLCAKTAGDFRWPLTSVIVAERGIAQVRNALVKAALTDKSMRFVAMLDDDEWPEPQWLDELTNVQTETGADVVRGTVLRDFEVPPPVWAMEWEGIASIERATGLSGMTDGTGNVLIARRCFDAVAEPVFDSQFGLTGGEDRDFFVRAQRLGMRFARARDAIVHEYVPADRITLRWSLLRAYRTGNSDMRIALKHQRGTMELAREIGKIVAGLALVPILSLAFSLSPKRRLHGLRKLYRVAGKLGALIGHRYYEYADLKDP